MDISVKVYFIIDQDVQALGDICILYQIASNLRRRKELSKG